MENLGRTIGASLGTQGDLPKAFVWTKMQADGGELIEGIRRRKELERIAGNGTFWWGVGESKGHAIDVLRDLDPRPQVLFSLMLSAPHAQARRPGRVQFWRSFLSDAGEMPLPKHVVVTSSPDRNGNPRRRYHALVCFSPTPLRLTGGGALDASRLINVGEDGKHVGSSQTTSAVTLGPSKGRTSSYPISGRATLTAPFFASLGSPRELSLSERLMLEEVGKEGRTVDDWLAAATTLWNPRH